MIKIAGCYKSKTNNDWILVNKKYGDGTYKCHIVSIEEDGYDEEIEDLTEKEIAEEFDTSVCYVPVYHKIYGLYKVWDGANRNTEIWLQNIYPEKG